MDQRARIEQDLTNIHQTRLAMTSKLEQLERRVQDSVQQAKTSARDVVDHTQDAAQQLIDRIEDLMVNTRQAIDPRYQINRHPWMMLGLAVAAGYVVGSLENRQSAPLTLEHRAAGATAVPDPPVAAGSGMNVWAHLSGRVQQELEVLKHSAFVMGESLLHEVLTQVLPALVAPLDPARRRQSPSSRMAASGSSRYAR